MGTREEVWGQGRKYGDKGGNMGTSEEAWGQVRKHGDKRIDKE